MMNRKQMLGGIAAVGLLLGVAGTPVIAGCNEIEPQELIQILGDDAVEVEVNLSGALLGLVGMAAEEELGDSTKLESLNVLIFDMAQVKGGDRDDRIEQAQEALLEIQRRLTRRGWERMARVREDGNDLSIMIQSDDEHISGMAVLGIDREDDSAMLISLCGVLDMAALADVAENLDIDLPEID